MQDRYSIVVGKRFRKNADGGINEAKLHYGVDHMMPMPAFDFWIVQIVMFCVLIFILWLFNGNQVLSGVIASFWIASMVLLQTLSIGWFSFSLAAGLALNLLVRMYIEFPAKKKKKVKPE